MNSFLSYLFFLPSPPASTSHPSPLMVTAFSRRHSSFYWFDLLTVPERLLDESFKNRGALAPCRLLSVDAPARVQSIWRPARNCGTGLVPKRGRLMATCWKAWSTFEYKEWIFLRLETGGSLSSSLSEQCRHWRHMQKEKKHQPREYQLDHHVYPHDWFTVAALAAIPMTTHLPQKRPGQTHFLSRVSVIPLDLDHSAIMVSQQQNQPFFISSVPFDRPPSSH